MPVRKIFITLLLCGTCFAAPVTVQVFDASGAPAKDVLVIVQTLDSNYRDVSRKLTDTQGGIGILQLKAGLYRAIATTPYGIWGTTVKEFLVSDTAVEVRLTVKPEPTRGAGDIVTVGIPTADLQVQKPDGTPAPGALVIVRDKNATLFLERFYRTDENGRVKIELVGAPTIVIVKHDGRLITTEFPQNVTHPVIRLSQD